MQFHTLCSTAVPYLTMLPRILGNNWPIRSSLHPESTGIEIQAVSFGCGWMPGQYSCLQGSQLNRSRWMCGARRGSSKYIFLSIVKIAENIGFENLQELPMWGISSTQLLLLALVDWCVGHQEIQDRRLRQARIRSYLFTLKALHIFFRDKQSLGTDLHYSSIGGTVCCARLGI